MKFATLSVNHRSLTLAGALLVGTALLRTLADDATDETLTPIDAPTPLVGTATQPVLVEPPGGEILWGFASATPQLEVTLDGRARAFHHAARGTGAMIRFALAAGCTDDIAIVRTAPGPRTVTHRDVRRVLTAYVPDGTYELSACDGPATRLEISGRAFR